MLSDANPEKGGDEAAEHIAKHSCRPAKQGVLGVQILNWQRAVARHWAKVHFGSLQVETVEGQYVFQLQVYLNEMEPEAVQVELYADSLNGGRPCVK